MRWISTALSLALLALQGINAQCATDMMEVDLATATKLSFVGFIPNVERITNAGMGNKIVLKNYSRMPMVVNQPDGIMAVSAGDFCTPMEEMMPSASPVDDSEDDGDSASSTISRVLALALPVLAGRNAGMPGYATAALGLATWSALGMTPMASASDTSACDAVPIDVEVYIDASADEIVMREAQSGDFEVCPPETVYWKHHPTVFSGYEGCVGEKGYYPCPVDSQGVWEEGGELAAMYPINWDGAECVETGFTTESRTFWILWGDPLDKYELNKRTGLNPVVSFPFNRGPYPRYEQGVPVEEAIDDSSDARAMAKEFLVYIGAFTAEELVDWEVTMTEGAEAGMTATWAAKALEIARTTCNRDIFALMEAPAYGYSPSDAAAMVNTEADTFYSGPECLCFNSSSCNDPTVTISNRGWLPLTPFPVEMGGDGMMYAADSTSPSSPWMESMVFPENPSGKIKTPQLADANRRVCDGVYVWPMYFGMTDFEIPMDQRPDCASWSFSITKAYSASVRAGFILYKKDAANLEANVDIQGKLYSMTHGLYSEWSWYGQMQLWEMIMSKPLSDPTSWIGAYSEIMNEKWELIIDGFADCPVATVTNPKAGAYVWFKYEPPYIGIQGGFVSSFFRDVLGIRTTTYNWGFRGSDPADFYGANYTTTDFTRLQLYRDVSVYEEVSRRAKIVCSDPDATVGDFISVNDWAAGMGTTTRRMTEGYETMDDRKRHLKEVMPGINDRQLEYLAKSHHESDIIDRNAAMCAPHYTMDCLFKQVGTSFKDY